MSPSFTHALIRSGAGTPDPWLATGESVGNTDH